MDGYPVKVNIYDISKGLARSMSMALLGKQIDGVWHTGVVVYGQEFFFGGGGIQSCPPMGTILGQPDSIHDLGTTHVPQDVFMEYLREQSSSAFRPECYHLLNHNCNTFSSEVSQFLTGKDIPSHITNLPAEVMSTPFGQMLKPWVESMSASPDGGHSVFPQGATSGTTSTGKSSGTSTKDTSKTASHQSKPDILDRDPVVFTGTVQQILEENKTSRENLKTDLPADSAMKTDDVMDFLMSVNGCVNSLSPQHIQTLGGILLNPVLGDSTRLVGGSLLQLLSGKREGVEAMKTDSNCTLSQVLHTSDTLPDQLLSVIIKMVVNCTSCKSGHELLISQAPVSVGKVTSTNLKLTTALCVLSLLNDHPDRWELGASAVTNLLFYGVNADTSVELGSAVLQCLTKELSDKTANLLLWAIVKMMKTNAEVRGLAAVMGVDWDRFSALSVRCRDLTKEAKRLVTT